MINYIKDSSTCFLAMVIMACLTLFPVRAIASGNNTYCDTLTGAAYGLCTAYCEAMDCDGTPQASDTACNRVADNIVKITGEIPRCEAVACPCWTDDVVTDLQPYSYCGPSPGGQSAEFIATTQIPTGDVKFVVEYQEARNSWICHLKSTDPTFPAVFSEISDTEANACIEAFDRLDVCPYP